MAFTTDGFLEYTDQTQNTSGVTEIADLGAITRKYDSLLPSSTKTWTDAHAVATWQTLYTPNVGESGEVWVIIEDELNSGWGFEVWEYDRGAGTVTLKSDDSDYDAGNETIGVQFQFDGADIEIANDGNPTAGHYLKAYCRIETAGV